LQRTELVNEAYMKLIGAKKAIYWRNRLYFFAICTLMVGRFLIDYARRRPTAKLWPVENLPAGIMAGRNRLEVALVMTQVLNELKKESRTTHSIMVARLYRGHGMNEIAEKFGLPLRTVERRWYDGRKWLYQRLSKEE
jgi:DNA-directed RNA polymerase specialized sigma24 family protein